MSTPLATSPLGWLNPRLIVAVALLVRAVTLIPAWDSAPVSDGAEYHRIATDLAAGKGFVRDDGKLSSWRPPLWPGMLSLLYRVTGPSPAAGRVLQVVLGSLLVGLIILVARAVEPDDPRVPAVAGWWATISPSLIYYSHGLWSESLFGLCLGSALLGLLRGASDRRGRWVALTGVGLGLASLCRGSTLFLLPLVPVWWVYAEAAGRRVGLARSLAALMLCGLVILPWTIRNYRVQHALVVIDTNGPVNFFYGNNPQTPRLRPWRVAEMNPRPRPQCPADAGEVEFGKAAVAEALVWIRTHPGEFLTSLAIKTGNLWGLSRGLPSGIDVGVYGPPSQAAVWLSATYEAAEGLLLLLLGVLGLGLSKRSKAVELELIAVLYLTIPHAICQGHSRYRFGALLLLYAFAAAALLGQRTWREDLNGLPASRRRLTLGVMALLLSNFLYEVLFLEILPRFG